MMSALAVTYERVGINLKLDDKELMKKFVIIEKALNIAFPDYSQEEIMAGLQKGSVGEYGMPRNFSAIQMCIWVREYVKKFGIRPKKIK